MLEKINEAIEVLVKFGQKIEPKLFRWRGKLYKIEKINLVHSERIGNDAVYYFSVTDNANFFRLSFNIGNLEWRVREIWYE